MPPFEFPHMPITALLLHSPPKITMNITIPSDQGAVLHHVFFNEDALGGIGLDHAAILVPQHLHVLGHEGGLALERQAVPMKDDLSLGRSQLEGGQLKRSV